MKTKIVIEIDNQPSKAQEVEALNALVAKFPKDSYLHMALVHLQAQFERDTRSDFPSYVEVRMLEANVEALSANAKLWETRRDALKAEAKALREAAQKAEQLLFETEGRLSGLAQLLQSAARETHESGKVAHRAIQYVEEV